MYDILIIWSNNALDIISDWKESTDAEMLQKALKDSVFDFLECYKGSDNIYIIYI